MSEERVDWSGMMSEVLDALKTEASDLIEGAESDINAYFTDIARDIVALAPGGPEAARDRKHLEGQLKILAGIHRLKVAQASNRVLLKIVSVARRAAVGALGSVTGLLG